MGVRKQICYGEFKIRCGWQYWRNSGGKRNPLERTKAYTKTFNAIYLEGEEDKAWEKVINDNFNESKTKTLYIESKSLKKLEDVGKTQHGS